MRGRMFSWFQLASCVRFKTKKVGDKRIRKKKKVEKEGSKKEMTRDTVIGEGEMSQLGKKKRKGKESFRRHILTEDSGDLSAKCN